jgi:hypothetical protein
MGSHHDEPQTIVAHPGQERRCGMDISLSARLGRGAGGRSSPSRAPQRACNRH